MRKYVTFGVIAALFLMFAAGGYAMDLQSAKKSGLVGETPSGYLAVVKASPEAKSLVDSVNAKRKQEYQDIAKRNNIALKDVEQLAGKKAIDKTPAGQFVQVGGKWVKK